jgi:glycosyltransferase involved in cell wall biosynthesis
VVDDRDSGDVGPPVFGASPEALFEGFSRTLISDSDWCVDILTCTKESPGIWERKNPNLKVTAIQIPRTQFLRKAYYGPLKAVLQRFYRHKPSIVHAQGTESWCAWVGAHCPFPKVLTLHGNVSLVNQAGPMKPYGYWLAQEFLESLSLPKYDRVFCNSVYSRRGVSVNARQTTLMPNPVRLEFFTPLPTFVANGPVPVILNIGVIQERKRQVELCRAAIRLHRRGFRFLLRFLGSCGEGPGYSNEFRTVLREAQEIGCAEYGGRRSASELVREMDHAAAIVHFPKEEAFGLVVAEALARNLKIFAADVGGIPDIVQGAPGAELFPPESWNGLMEGIGAWLRGGAVRPTGGAELAGQRFHPEVIAKAHLAVYREVLLESA